MLPTIGRIVHFYEQGQLYPGIITKVWTDVCVNLVIFGHLQVPGGLEKTSVVYNEVDKNYNWVWPPRN